MHGHFSLRHTGIVDTTDTRLASSRAARLPALAADCGHVRAIATHRDPAFAPRFTCFV